MNLYEQQRSNRRKTWIIMFAFVAFLLVLGLGFDAFYLGEAGGAAPIGTLVALAVGSVSALASYFGDWHPASTTLCVNQLSSPGARIELDMIVALPKGSAP